MDNKHQNADENYIVIGGKRRWFETPISREHPAKQQADNQRQASSAKKKNSAWQMTDRA